MASRPGWAFTGRTGRAGPGLTAGRHDRLPWPAVPLQPDSLQRPADCR